MFTASFVSDVAMSLRSTSIFIFSFMSFNILQDMLRNMDKLVIYTSKLLCMQGLGTPHTLVKLLSEH